MKCYVVDCDEDARYWMVISTKGLYCPKGKDCPGHGFCEEHTAHNRRAAPEMVISVRSLRPAGVS